MQILNDILNTLNQVPSQVWDMAIQIILSAVLTSTAALGVKKWLDVNRERLMVVGVMAASFIGPVLIYLKTVPEFAAWIVLVQGGLVFATTQPVYYFFVKPLFQKLSAGLASQLLKAEEMNKVKNDLKSALEPAGGLKVNADPVDPAAVNAARVDIQDFNP